MPKKNAKQIKKTRKQKKKSELKKKVRRVIRKKYTDDDVLYQAEREYYSSSSSDNTPSSHNSTPPKKRRKRAESSSDSTDTSDDSRYKKSSKKSTDNRRKKYSEESTDDRHKKYSEESTDGRHKKYSEESTDDRRKKYSEESIDDRHKKYSEESVDDRRKKYPEESTDDRRKKYPEESVDDRRKKYSEESVDDRQKKYPEESVVDRHKKYPEESVDDRQKKYPEESVDDRQKKYPEESVVDRQKKYLEESVDGQKKYSEESIDDRQKKYPQESVDDRQKKYSEESEDGQKKYSEESEDRQKKYSEESEDRQKKYSDESIDDRQKSSSLLEYSGVRSIDIDIDSNPVLVGLQNDLVQEEVREEVKQESSANEFDEKLLEVKFQYVYENEEVDKPTELYSSKKIEEFILSKGFMILEYFVVHDLCSFILIQLPAICETMMVYINRKKFPIQVSDSSYKKTCLEKLRIEKCEDDTYDYENMSLSGFDLSHSLDTIQEINQKQKSLAYYVYRQISRMMYVTKNIEIKPCILLNGIFGFYEIYHMVDRKPSKEFYPVITLETLFSKTFLLEQNIPVFYQRFYGIMNQSNRNKMDYLQTSLGGILRKMELLQKQIQGLEKKDLDKKRVKSIVDRLDERIAELGIEKKSVVETVQDRVAQSYHIKRLDEQHSQIDLRKAECNALYSEIKREYDQHVFHHELMFHELYYKIRDMESLLRYLD